MDTGGPVRGEEFADDLRLPENTKFKLLPPERIRELSEIDNWQATTAVARTFAIIIGAVTFAYLIWDPVLVAATIAIIATQQHALIVLCHESTHYRLFNPRWLNDLVGRTCGMVVGVSMCTYRIVHRLHHNHLYQDQDPDIPLHGGYPRGRIYLAKKLFRDFCGLSAWKTYAYFFGAPSTNTESSGKSPPPLDDTSKHLQHSARDDRRLVAGIHLTALFLAFASGYGLKYLLLWVLPLATVVPALLRLRALCEHGAVDDITSPLRAARTNFSPRWLQWILFPHNVNYHLEHHIYPAIPQYKLPDCHREMVKLDAFEKAEIRSVQETFGLLFADSPAAK